MTDPEKSLHNPKISVIMSVYNGEAHLTDSIASILDQTFANFEFIIVNDCSTDNSPEIIRSFRDDRIRVINNEKNIGLTKSLNRALKVARAEYIARQDADDISLPDRFKRQLEYMEDHQEVALLGTSIFVIGNDGEILEKRIAAPDPGKTLLRGNRFCHGSVMIRREVLDKTGLYNELFKYSQDYELWLRISKHHKARNLTEPLYKLRFYSGSIGASRIVEQAMFVILAQKQAKNGLDAGTIDQIKNSEFERIYQSFSRSEKVRFHNITAYNYVQNDDMKLAKQDYVTVFRLDPFCLENNLHIIASLAGKRGIWMVENLYRSFRHILYKIIRLKI